MGWNSHSGGQQGPRPARERMKMSASSEIFLFGEFRLDRVGGGLFRRGADGVFVPVAIGSRALEILAALVERRGDIVSKEDIVGAGWPRTVVADSNLFVQIAALRRILDAAQSGQSCIQTVIGRGYRFIAPVTRDATRPAPGTATASSRGGHPTPRPSIAVLPFANMSGDPEQEYFADGMVEEIITALSRIRWLFVLARNSGFTYKGPAIDLKQLGREFGVRDVLEGSFRKAGNR